MKMFKIMKMRESDEEEVIALLNKHFPHVGMTSAKLELRLSRGSCFFVAKEEGKMAGFCELRLGKHALLCGIAVDERYRGTGVATGLVEAAISEALKKGEAQIYLKTEVGNEEALRLYGKLGFTIRRELVGRNGERLFLMRKELEN